MKKYNITVNGTTYEVIVEEVDGSVSHAPTYTAPVTPVSTQAAPKASPAASAGGANKVVAPMPGTILDMKVSVGQAVKKGDVICVLAFGKVFRLGKSLVKRAIARMLWTNEQICIIC